MALYRWLTSGILQSLSVIQYPASGILDQTLANQTSAIMILPILYIAPTESMGRGVFTSEAIEEGTIIEIAPVIVMEKADRKLLDQTLLHDYIFEWGGDKQQCCMALGYVPVYNHSYTSNCEYEMDFEEDTISIKTMRYIKAGEELFVNYNGSWNDNKPVWFHGSL